MVYGLEQLVTVAAISADSLTETLRSWGNVLIIVGILIGTFAAFKSKKWTTLLAAVGIGAICLFALNIENLQILTDAGESFAQDAGGE